MKGLQYLHSLDIPHGNLKGVGYFLDPSSCISTSRSFLLGCAIMLILWRQTNIVIDHKDRARLTEYGLGPIRHGPIFTATATSGTLVSSRILPPEFTEPSGKRKGTLMLESKAADVFAFGMLVVEVFTGEAPFGEQKNEAVVLRILRGDRPKMPGNAQAVGLTHEMWALLENCWHQNPKKRPTMEEVMERWQNFVGDDNNVVPECV